MSCTMFTPDYSHLTGLLQQLNDEELKELLNNEEKLKNLVNDLKQIQDIEAEKEMLFASNKSLSEYNLSKKIILEQYRQQVQETHKMALNLKNSFLEKKRKIENCEKAVSRDTLLALLQTATSEKEEEAEASVEFFLKSEVSVEDFIDQYLELKKLAHLRRIKAEKLANIIIGDEGRNLSPPFRQQRSRIAPSPPTPKSDLPYPNVDTQNNLPYGPIRTAPPRPYLYPVYPSQQPYTSTSYSGYYRPPAHPYSQYK